MADTTAEWSLSLDTQCPQCKHVFDFGPSFLKAARLSRFAKRILSQLVIMKQHARSADMNLRANSCTED